MQYIVDLLRERVWRESGREKKRRGGGERGIKIFKKNSILEGVQCAFFFFFLSKPRELNVLFIFFFLFFI